MKSKIYWKFYLIEFKREMKVSISCLFEIMELNIEKLDLNPESQSRKSPKSSKVKF